MIIWMRIEDHRHVNDVLPPVALPFQQGVPNAICQEDNINHVTHHPTRPTRYSGASLATIIHRFCIHQAYLGLD
ncbi:hypothetical protein TNCV_3089261 [Trichonephila clavipes]|nr:hypothetical protein TNCV_3089261 [Trichonephila clavipes]